MDSDQLFVLLKNWHLWLVAAVAFLLGGVGGLLRENDATAVVPVSGPRDFAVGGIAAIGLFYVTNPTTGLALLGGSIVAGYASKVVLAGLQSRVVAKLGENAKREARAAKDDAFLARRDLTRLIASTRRLGASGSEAPMTAAELVSLAAEIESRHGSRADESTDIKNRGS